MSSGSSESPGGATDRLRNWDHPDGLGWQLWRRVHSTGLLSTQIQRDLARLRANILMNRAPLVADIQRRWGLGQDPVGNRFHPDLPFFFARFPLFYANTPYEQPASPRRSLRPSVDAPSVSSLSGMSRLSGISGPSTVMKT